MAGRARETPEEEAEQGGVKILWIPVRTSSYMETALQNYQAVIDPGKPLAGMSTPNRDRAWVTICNEIKKAINAPQSQDRKSTRLNSSH